MSLASRTVALATLLLFALLAPLQALAAETVHLYLEAHGTTIVGEATASGFEGAIELDGVVMKAVTEDDGRTAASSHRRILPIRFMKRIDQTSPLLFEAWATGATIDFAEIRYSRTGDSGRLETYQTVRLEGGHLSSIETKAEVATAGEPPLEEVEIVFSTIRWTWEDDGISTSRSWSAR